tara:strand:- start:53831 stop:54721 length:891 start_codon:yes stop_codon:yes gene_type:complete
MKNPILSSIFYSWQSDLPPETSRQPIHDAIISSISNLSSHPRVVESPRIDHDTKNVGGTPEIAGTIFRKIEQAAIFVADVTITSQTSEVTNKRKYSPNANVMLEAGYAASSIGWDRIILVMNERYGGPTKLPFDLRNRRWPIMFSSKKLDEGNIVVLDGLVSRLEEQISMCLAAEYARAEDAIAKLAPHARRIMRRLALANTFNDGEPKNNLISRDDFHTQQMITLGLIRCVADTTPFRSHMEWTYLGRECCRRLGVDLPAESELHEWTTPSNVFLDTSTYDSLQDSIESELTTDP